MNLRTTKLNLRPRERANEGLPEGYKGLTLFQIMSKAPKDRTLSQGGQWRLCSYLTEHLSHGVARELARAGAMRTGWVDMAAILEAHHADQCAKMEWSKL